MSNENLETDSAGDIQSVDFHYIKSGEFRVVHVDGGLGGPTARGYIYMGLYNERRAMPQRTTITMVDADTEEAQESVTETTRGGIVREVEVGLMLDEHTTEEVILWLTNQLQKLRAAKAELGLDDA